MKWRFEAPQRIGRSISSKSLVSILFSGLYGNCYEKKQLSRVICVIMNGLFLICCSETVSLGVWSCHVELAVDCRLVGRWLAKNCKR